MRTRKSKSSRRIRRKYSKVRRKTTKRRLRTKRRNRYRTKNRSRHNTRRTRHKRTRRRSKRMTHGTKNLNKFVLVKNMRGGANCLCDDDLDAGVDTELLSKLDNKDIEMEEAYREAAEGGRNRFKLAVTKIIAEQRKGQSMDRVVERAMGQRWWNRVKALARENMDTGQKGGGLDVDVDVRYAYKEFFQIVMGEGITFDEDDPNKNSKDWKFCPSELSKHVIFLNALKDKIGKTHLLEGLKNYRAQCVWPIMNYYERIFKFYRVAATNNPRKVNKGSTPYLILNHSDSVAANLEIKSITPQQRGTLYPIGVWPWKERMTPASAESFGIEIPAPQLFKDFLDDNSYLPAHDDHDLEGMSGYIYILLMKKYSLPLPATSKTHLARLLIYVACSSVKDILWYHCCIHPDILSDADMELHEPITMTEEYRGLVVKWRRDRGTHRFQRRLNKIKYKSALLPATFKSDQGVQDMWKRSSAETIAELRIFLSADTKNLFETIGYEEQKVPVAGTSIILKEKKKEGSKREQVVGLYPFWILHDIIHPPSSGGTGDWIGLYSSLDTPTPILDVADKIANKIKHFYTKYPSEFPATQEDEMGMLVAQRNSLSRLAITAECEYALRDREDLKIRFDSTMPATEKVSYFSGYVFQNPDTGDYYWTPDCEHIFPFKYVALYFGQPLIGEHFTVFNSSKRIRQNELLEKLKLAIDSADSTLLPSKIADLWTHSKDAWNNFTKIHYSELQNFYGWGESSVNRFIKGDKLVYNVAFKFDPNDPANVTDVRFTPTAGGGGGIIWDTMLKSEGSYLPPWGKRFHDSGNYKFLYLSGVSPQTHMVLTTAYGEDLNKRFDDDVRRKFWMNDGPPDYDETECLHIQLLKKVIAPSHKLDDFKIKNNLSTLKIINHFIITTSMLLYSFPKIKFNDDSSGVEVGQKFLNYAIYWIWKFLTLFIKKTTPDERPPDAIRNIIILAILETYYTRPIIKTKIESAILSLDAKAKKKKT